ncbi:unnamed protein product [Malus baccata var. baccata]
MSCKGYARLGDELRNKGTPEEDLNRVNLWIAARTRKNGQPDDIKLVNELPTTDNALGPEHRGRLRGGGYGVTPSRYDAQTIKLNMLRDRLQNVEGKLREVFDLVLAKQQNELIIYATLYILIKMIKDLWHIGNGKETNTNDAIQVSTDGPQGGSIDLQRTKNGVKQVPNSSYQVSRSSPQYDLGKFDEDAYMSYAPLDIYKLDDCRSSPNIKRDSVKRKEGSKATFQGLHALLNWLENGKVVATGEIESTNPEVKVHHMVLGPDCWKVWVTVVRVENMSLYRPTTDSVKLDPNTSTIAWPSKYIQKMVLWHYMDTSL